MVRKKFVFRKCTIRIQKLIKVTAGVKVCYQIFCRQSYKRLKNDGTNNICWRKSYRQKQGIIFITVQMKFVGVNRTVINQRFLIMTVQNNSL